MLIRINQLPESPADQYLRYIDEKIHSYCVKNNTSPLHPSLGYLNKQREQLIQEMTKRYLCEPIRYICDSNDLPEQSLDSSYSLARSNQRL